MRPRLAGARDGAGRGVAPARERRASRGAATPCSRRPAGRARSPSASPAPRRSPRRTALARSSSSRRRASPASTTSSRAAATPTRRPTSVQVAPLCAARRPEHAEVTLTRGARRRLARALGRRRGLRLAPPARASGSSPRIEQPRAYALLRVDGEPVAQARAVADGDATSASSPSRRGPAYRRRGLAAACIGRSPPGARARGATTAYLLVEHDNAPALALYRRLGFEERFTYWYRARRLELRLERFVERRREHEQPVEAGDLEDAHDLLVAGDHREPAARVRAAASSRSRARRARPSR